MIYGPTYRRPGARVHRIVGIGGRPRRSAGGAGMYVARTACGRTTRMRVGATRAQFLCTGDELHSVTCVPCLLDALARDAREGEKDAA